MSFYHISTSLNRQKPRINIRSSRKYQIKLEKCKHRAVNTCSHSHIVRPVYAEENCIVGYITVPLTEWASTLIL